MTLSPLDVIRVLVGAPLLLIIPGYLLLLPLAPSWSPIPRAAVGATVTIAVVSLSAWVTSSHAGMPFTQGAVRLLYLGLLLISLAVALVGRRAWWSVAIPRLERKHLVLGGVLAGGVLLLSLPRWGYAYPLHVDEWWHLAVATAMERQAAVDLVAPALGVGNYRTNPEIAYHVFLATIRFLTGADWLSVFRLGPLVIGGFTILAAWAAGEREGYGVEAALLVALLPTSLRVLGPQLLVPLELGLMVIPSAFLLFTNPHPRRTLPILLGVIVFLFFAHPQSAVAVGILVGTYALIAFPRGWVTSVVLVAIAIVPVVLGVVLLEDHLDPERLVAAESRLPVPEFVALFGIAPSLLFLAGVYLTSLKPSAERLGWVATSFVHLLLVTLFLLWKIGQPNLYDRAWMHGILTMSMTAGYALYRLRGAAFWNSRALVGRVATSVAVVILVASSVTAQAGRDAEYYHVISDEDHAAFVWIRDNIEPNGTRALIEPWQSTAFSAITGLRSDLIGHNSQEAADRTLRNGAVDDRLLDRWNVTLIYSPIPVKNVNFTEVHPQVYVRVGPGK